MVFMPIFMLGVVAGVACCVIVQWLIGWVEKLWLAEALGRNPSRSTVVIQYPCDITVAPEGKYYHVDSD